MLSFSAQIEEWANKSDRQIDASVRDAIQTTYHEMVTPQAKGGRMPVDTGTLRNSAQPSQTSMPKTILKAGAEVGQYDVVGYILDMKLGQPLFIGFTMEYGPIMENRYAFVTGAAQNWQRNVSNSAMKAAKAIK